MGLIEIILIVLLICWLFGGLVALPITGGFLNIIVVVVLIWIIWRISNGRRIQ